MTSADPAAIYERELDASLDRIWENVLDWQHLPFLHSQSFTSVKMHSIDADGWHGEVGVPGVEGEVAEIDVRIDRSNLCYTTATVAGPGVGTSIVTQLFPRGPRQTGIRVEFYVPWAPAGTEDAIGDFYRTLYVQLWDQDQAMMAERQRVLDASTARAIDGVRSLSLGSMRDLAGRLPMVVELGDRRFRVVSMGGQLFAHDTLCPHLGGPLHETPLEGCEIVCPWHGYRFDVRTGQSTDGNNLRLRPAAVVEIDACSAEVRLRLP